MKNLETLIQELCPDGVEFVKIGEVAKVGTGSSNRQDAVDDGKYPFYVRSKNILASDTYEFDDESIIIPGEGGIGEIFHYVKGKYALHQRVYRINFYDERINVKFVYYYMYSCFKRFIMKKAVSATVTSIRKPMIEKFEFPLPPIEVQTEIVRILDKFTSLEAELEAELDCRKRQYEYYRDKLLSFDNVGGQEVEWKKMSEVGTFIRGNGLQKKDFTEEGVGCIHYGQLYTHYGTSATETITYCSSELAKKLRKAAKGDIVIATTSENVEDVCKAVAWLGEEEIAVSGDAFIYKHTQNPKYMAYLFQTASFFNYKKKKATGTKVIRLTGDAMGNYLAPIPSLEEQHRIVSILDRFESLTTSLQSGLPAEIAARRQQYEHYRDKLLTFKRKGAA